jgi:hypothetical protein
MKKLICLVPALLGLTAINVAAISLSFIEKAEAITASDWQGTWNCNLDGRSIQINFWLHYNQVIGQVGDDAWALKQRSFDPSSDPATARTDHVLPLSDNNNEKWFLMMHTWDQRYASGFTRWQGSVYGLQCSRQ